MKKTLLRIVTASLVAGLAFCGKKGDTDVQESPPPEPGSFGIARTVWDTTVTPQDRMKLAISIKDKDVKLVGGEKAAIETNKGDIVVELYSKDAPQSVSNFIKLAESGFYDGLIWHRYAPGFVIQGGDPLGNGCGDAGYNLQFLPNPKKHVRGALGWAHGGQPNTGSCQFYICLGDAHHLDRIHVVFGKVLEGMDAVNELRRGDSIIRITVTRDVPEEPPAGE